MQDVEVTRAPGSVGPVLVGVAASAIASIGFAVGRLTTNLSGDPLAFVGALLGAALAVLGAEFIANRQKRADRAEARAYQYEILMRIRDAIKVVTADFKPNPDDAHEFNKTVKAIPEAISSMKRDSALLESPDVQRSAGWNVAIVHVPRLIEEAQPGLTRFNDQDIANGHQAALAVAMSQAIGDLNPALRQVERCMIDLRPRFGPPRR